MTSLTIGSPSFGWWFNKMPKLSNVTLLNSVYSIEPGTFQYCPMLASLTIPNSVTNIASGFYGSTSLEEVYFLGNSPSLGITTFFNATNVTVYYLPGATGWGATFGGCPAVLWNPQATTLNSTGGHFGFNITGPTNAVIVVEACTNLANPVWLPVSTNTLSGGASSFSDTQSSNYPSRFYRFRSP